MFSQVVYLKLMYSYVYEVAVYKSDNCLIKRNLIVNFESFSGSIFTVENSIYIYIYAYIYIYIYNK